MNDKVTVIDNFLPEYYYKAIESRVLSIQFPWNFVENISSVDGPKLGYEGLSHPVYSDKRGVQSEEHSFILPFALQVQSLLNSSKILRVRLDSVLFSKDIITYEPHTDLCGLKHMSSIFYIGNSDGDTIIYNETQFKECGKNYPLEESLTEYIRVKPKPNRLVLFKGEHLHTGENPSKHSRRVLINSNYLI
jgi:hypothetical protein